MSGNVVNCCVFFFSRRYPWSGASVIGLIICRLRVMEHAPIVSGHGKRRWLHGKKTRIRDSWFGLRTKAHTCAISVLHHAQICHRKIPENSSSGRMKSVTISERRGWIHHNIGHKGLPGRPLPRDLAKSMDNKCTSSIDNGVRSECSANSNWRIAESSGLPSMWGPKI